MDESQKGGSREGDKAVVNYNLLREKTLRDMEADRVADLAALVENAQRFKMPKVAESDPERWDGLS